MLVKTFLAAPHSLPTPSFQTVLTTNRTGAATNSRIRLHMSLMPSAALRKKLMAPSRNRDILLRIARLTEFQMLLTVDHNDRQILAIWFRMEFQRPAAVLRKLFQALRMKPLKLFHRFRRVFQMERHMLVMRPRMPFHIVDAKFRSATQVLRMNPLNAFQRLRIVFHNDRHTETMSPRMPFHRLETNPRKALHADLMNPLK